MKPNDSGLITPDEFADKYSSTDMPCVTSLHSQEERTRRILALSERMIEKVDSAIEELTKRESRIKEKTKEVEYDPESKKPVFETNTEKESVEIYDTLIDTGALRQLVSTLKDIKDIHLGLTSEQNTDDGGENGVIVISGINAGGETL